jgi:hypothetical protein
MEQVVVAVTAVMGYSLPFLVLILIMLGAVEEQTT